MDFDDMDYEILGDGTIKWTIGKVSAPNHMNAEEFQRAVAKLTGGETKRTRRGDVHHHHHDQVKEKEKLQQ